MESNQESLSILMFPWLAHGHAFPYLELAKNLTKHNFTIFFCSTPIILQSLPIPHHLPITLIPLHLPSPPELPPDLHTTKHAPPHLMPLLHDTFHASKPAFSAILASLRPDILIFDAFQPWAAEAAAKFEIPAVHFAATGAAAYSFYYHLCLKKTTPFPHDALYLRPHEMEALQQAADSNLGDSDLSEGLPHFTRSRDVILMKTSRGLEGKYLDYLSLLCNKKIVPVGPLITTTTTTITTEKTDSDIMDWLSKKERLSTIYISFGSENYLNKKQVHEMAKGLEASRANFIWVVRLPLGEREEEEIDLPLGFEERVGERGKIVKGWAPQAEILSHENVCGFVSHCGMSSMIESVYFGVPVISIPFKVDQPLNSRVLVEAGVGVEVARDDNGDFQGDDVAEAIGRVVEGGEGMRARAAGMRETMRGEEECAVASATVHLRRICREGFVKHNIVIEKNSLGNSTLFH
ncbi:beta-D-glucosyl crocetin beta-1,6-glucosyltransferase-like [Salvia hispanica]|uniref:beta-D-glucosyl crocetin beta-1,6-glucosyltransferase-like n=1 Tax=Salvia hispanica TaxID=49212 RepID=UPI0020095938|nr:beta-D-glucosyl crocetin beta-1,6-glucosyltransferase-like [Salvia hispanica]XP_047975007.1 beta-D-glucosyl crocetin beta-1,6-glucosyltransferase-like [Salvia hispanica]